MDEPTVHEVRIFLCSLCLDGAGGECHVPGCALFLNRAPDRAIRDSGLVLTIDGVAAGPYADAEHRPPTLADWVAAAEGSELVGLTPGTVDGEWALYAGDRPAVVLHGHAVSVCEDHRQAGSRAHAMSRWLVCTTPAELRAALDRLAREIAKEANRG